MGVCAKHVVRVWAQGSYNLKMNVRHVLCTPNKGAGIYTKSAPEKPSWTADDIWSIMQVHTSCCKYYTVWFLNIADLSEEKIWMDFLVLPFGANYLIMNWYDGPVKSFPTNSKFMEDFVNINIPM